MFEKPLQLFVASVVCLTAAYWRQELVSCSVVEVSIMSVSLVKLFVFEILVPSSDHLGHRTLPRELLSAHNLFRALQSLLAADDLHDSFTKLVLEKPFVNCDFLFFELDDLLLSSQSILQLCLVGVMAAFITGSKLMHFFQFGP